MVAMLYTATVFGWTTIIEADSKREAVQIAKGRAPGVSLLRSDVNESHVRQATEDDLAWFNAMTFDVTSDETHLLRGEN